MLHAKSVAIVGVGGMFPSSPTLERFWDNIVGNVNTSRKPPEGRWLLSPDEIYDPQVGAADKVYSQKACFIDDEVDTTKIPGLELDPTFLSALDPMFRLLLRVGHDTFASVNGSKIDRSRAGIIIGNLALPTEKSSALARDFLGHTFLEKLTDQKLTLDESPVAPINHYVAGLPAGLLAKTLGFEGTCFTVDAACASSLYAIKLAVDELQSGRADAMLAGGLSRPDSLYTQMGFSQLRALSPNGTCSPFDRAGNGLVVGEGCGLVMLKRVQDAIRDGDHIHAVIRGIGLSNDLGGNLLAPAAEGQLRAMKAAYQQAGWEPDDVDLIECHATGTPVGDAVEFSSLQQLWQERGWRSGQCVIGSVKANIGHLLTAAGSAAMVKTLLAMDKQTLPPTANFNQPATGISFAKSPFQILSKAKRWEARKGGLPRRAAVSAFGFGGINAHLLLEEWTTQDIPKTTVRLHPSFKQKRQPVAIVGMAAQFGPWDNLEKFQHRVLGGGDRHQPETPKHWWGAQQCDWYHRAGFDKINFRGYFVPEVFAAPGDFRIPPKEQEEMLPRQLLMLKIAAAALKDAHLTDKDLLFSGVYIGSGLDLNATNFSFRWGLQKYARKWAADLGLQLDEQEFAVWLKELREKAGPALTANRTMGALGSVVASRIAKEFRIGGPSFTLSAEENSGLKALEVGIHSLQEGSINRAIVGAVDLAGDLRAVLSKYREGSFQGSLIGEGAAAVILKRLDDARQDGDQIYAVINGTGSAIGGEIYNCAPDESSYSKSIEIACQNSNVSADTISYFEADGSGQPANDHLELNVIKALSRQNPHSYRCKVGSVKAAIGHAGAAAGLASLIKTALCLQQRILPPEQNLTFLNSAQSLLSPAPQYWLHNNADGPRRALVSGIGGDGSCSQVLLQEAGGDSDHEIFKSSGRSLGMLPEGLFVVEAASVKELLHEVDLLRQFTQKNQDLPIDHLARLWFVQNPLDQAQPLCLSFVAASTTALDSQLTYAHKAITANPSQPIGVEKGLTLDAVARDRIFYSPKPIGVTGKVAFVFPGSGNHYAGMGRELSALWPEIYRQQDKHNQYLADQYLPEYFWKQELAEATQDNHNALVISHVAQCTALNDLLRQFGIQPQMISGYSLGESAGLFSSGAWKDRDGMLQRLHESPLFTEELAGECRAAKRTWGLRSDQSVDWVLGMVNLPAHKVRECLQGKKQVYLLIVNTHRESVIGGNRDQVEQLVAELGCHFIPLHGVTTVHCEVTQAVADAYRNLHLFDVTVPQNIDFYSCALGKKYPLTSANAADVILAQALDTIDYPRVIEQLYADGARIFLEVGPGSSCCRMIDSILEGQPHLTRSICAPGLEATTQVLRLLGSCLAERVKVDLNKLYPALARVPQQDEISAYRIDTTIGGDDFDLVAIKKMNTPLNEVDYQPNINVTVEETTDPDPAPETASEPILAADVSTSAVAQFQLNLTANIAAHEAYLGFSKSMEEALADNISLQSSLLQQLVDQGEPISSSSSFSAALPLSAPTAPAAVKTPPLLPQVAFDRSMCMEFAIGSVAKMLGPDFAEVDTYPTRVRLPDGPLMLVDRILEVEGVPRSMTHGRVVTEHDVTADRWYLDGGRIPTCVAVEAGQADLFLSAYLGIDFISKGLAVYRLLDAVVTFHRGLPVVGDTIRYDIKIEEFFRQDQTYLFRFNFEGTVNGEPLLSMRNGCAGFFTAEDLAAGKGIVHTKLDLAPQPGRLPENWQQPLSLALESYNEAQVNALYAGDLQGCFGRQFATLPFRPYTLPGGQLKLVDRVIKLDPQGGRYGLGQITAEMDIHPDDWFLTCHFVDDQVMPGTLMYECCMHTLRIFLLRMGWVGPEGETWCEPVPGVDSGLKCRGQVIATTKTVTYQVSIKELGYRPEPFAIVDALMFADGHPIVEIPDMSARLAGLDRHKVESLWLSNDSDRTRSLSKKILYDTERITAFAIGKPSEAFGEPYRVFDTERKIARLPGPPFQFLDRIVAINGEPWKLVEGVTVTAEYDVPADAWYFAANRQSYMPFCVLLEIGLQPCGWLAAYLGSALTSETDLSFRNLDGNAVQHRPVTAQSGTLTIDVKITRISSSGGMIIQAYDFTVSDSKGPVYSGDTVFGFFSKQSLAQQVGVQGATLYQVTSAEEDGTEQFSFPHKLPYPDEKMRMIDAIECFSPQGGPHGLGYIRGVKKVNPEEWFFKAHFYQDPVCPGSLGLESFLQLLKVVAAKQWGVDEKSQFESVVCGEQHSWNYRGQIIPTNRQVKVEAVITAIDNDRRILHADGFLSVDSKIIYQLKDFTICLRA
ncbi:PfaB family protein [Desulfuromusa kysingii]|uniref:PfaB family protein n=1 Tax=Desulfuromusa kysingii TaxID=37625 RepID=A0A1H4DQA7_9BACT|nr:type I polyketide synthase [Desulfuromusa kysingii]SEA74610.1 PfaB family protein [Desulfuromusa kysingii]